MLPVFSPAFRSSALLQGNMAEYAVVHGFQGKGYGKRLVQAMLGMCVGIEGVVFVKAHRWELGFYSLMGFNCQGPEE